METFFTSVLGRKILWAIFSAIILLAAFLLFETIAAAMGLRYIGVGIQATNTIAVSGTGDAYAVPDTAEFSFSVVSDKPTVKAAQDDATAKANTLTDYLKGAGIADKDIQTTDYNISPKYEYSSSVCPQPLQSAANSSGVAIATPVYCPPGKQVLTGYEVTQATQVKVRDTSKAGDLLAGVGSRGATDVSGLDFTVDDPTAVQTDARDKAIADAKAKAQKLADELGVSLVRVTGFSENQGGNPIPMVYSAAAGSATNASVAPEISPGQNKVTDNVTITYEIR